MLTELPGAIVPALEASGFIGIWDWNVTTGEVRLDPRSAEMVAGDASLAGQIITLDEALCCLHSDDRARVMDQIGKMGRIEGSISAEYRVRLPSGEIRWLLDRGRVARQPDGTLRGYGVWTDITDSRRIAEVDEPASGLEIAADHCLIARAEIQKAGSPLLRHLADVLLLELGRSLARSYTHSGGSLH